MLGAILGDIIGSPYERFNHKSKDFRLFRGRSRFTDDSVMTIAVAEALTAAKAKNGAEQGDPGQDGPEQGDPEGGGLKTGCLDDEAAVKDLLIDAMHKWGNKYPGAGYGGRFYAWLENREREPYNSWGNGSAMRVSPAGWLGSDLMQVRQLARWSAEVTHSHPEGVKGAEAVAAAIYLARTGQTKEEIKDYITLVFGYDLDKTCDEIRPFYIFDVSCQGSVPEAIIAFLEGEDFEDTVRNAVSLGGDSDTIAAMAGSIAGAFFGIPAWLKEKAFSYMDEEMKEVYERFQSQRE